MDVRVTTAFNDLTIAGENKRRREIDDVFDAGTDRAGYLEGLGYVERIVGPAPAEIVQPDAIPQPGAIPQPEAPVLAPADPVPPVSPIEPSPPATADFHVAHD